MHDLAGMVAVVSGAAKGIGRACAERLAAAGASVIVADLREDEGAATVRSIVENGGKAEFLPLDVTSEDSWIALAAHVDKSHGKLDVLVNNAGIAISSPDTSQMKLADFERQLAVNVTGVFLGCKHAIPLLRKAGKGSIINVSSTAGMRGSRGMAGYSASKGAVRLFSKALAQELGPQGIRVNLVSAGPIKTVAARSIPGFHQFEDAWDGRSPLGWNVKDSSAVAKACVAMLSDWFPATTGEILHVDGGYHAMGA